MRLVAGTNRKLSTLVKQKKFREDLFHRLYVVPVNVPPLRERVEDIPLLVEHILKGKIKGGKPIDIEVGHLVPCTLDWNGDGKKDLIVGQFAGGKIRLYLNQGTDKAPEFGDFSFLEAGGEQISLPAG